MHIKYSALFFIVMIIGFLSCKNNDNVFKPVTYTDLTVVNATADTLNFYLDGTRQNNSSSLHPGGLAVHTAVFAGSQNFQFKKVGSASVLLNIPLKLNPNVFNSLYIAGETPDKVFNTLDTLVTDALPNLATVRFVNASPDAGNLTVTIGDTTYVKSSPFKSSSGFFIAGSGQKVIKVYQFGGALPKIDTIIAFQANRAYTLFSEGLLNGKGNSAFRVGIILNQ